MLKNNILIKITGSIAAYKAGYLISKLVQNNFNVRVAVTESALEFIGPATLEGLNGSPIYSDTFEQGKMMSHIDLVKWADLTILAPADANTINKFSAGIADNLVTSLFLARDPQKPYLIAPAMNTAMYDHPATQESLKKLKKWGIHVLPTDEGYLACGDLGKGKLLEPDRIYSNIVNHLSNSPNKLNFLITLGGTKEKIDNVRSISNLSTGQTGISIAEYLYQKGHQVTIIKSFDSLNSNYDIESIEYDDFQSLQNNLKLELGKRSYDAVIHLAAVSDYSPVLVKIGDIVEDLPTNLKLNSESDFIEITFKRNEKIINNIKSWSLNESIKLIGFKLVDSNDNHKKQLVKNLLKNSNSDIVVYNSWEQRIGNIQHGFEIFNSAGEFKIAEDALSLAAILENLLLED